MNVNTHINELELSERAKKSLQFFGNINTLGDLVRCDLEKIRNLRNIGPKTFEEIQSFLSSLEIEK